MPKPPKPPGKPRPIVSIPVLTAIEAEEAEALVPYMILQTTPRLPLLMDTAYAAPSGSTIVVGDGQNFQTALNNAEPGDVITLNAGSTYTGNFTLPAKGGSEYIHIRSSASLTPEGTRVATGDLTAFPKIATGNASPAIQAAAGSSHYRLINCDIKSGTTATTGGLVCFGSGTETDVDDFPHHVVIDRCGVRGHATNGGRRGVLFSGDYQAVIDSYLSDWKEVGADTQAVCGWTGHGPWKIVNCYLEGAGENVMFGGADTAISGLTPSDIEFRGNYCFKPLTWKEDDPSYLGTLWAVKNLFELKHCQRVSITDNVFENCWAQGQTGFGILFTPLNSSGTNPWTVVNDVTFLRNTVRNVVGGMQISGHDHAGQISPYSRRMLIQRNLFYNVTDKLFQIFNGYADLNIDHNTANHAGNHLIQAAGVPMERFKFTNNITVHCSFGVIGDGFGVGSSSLDHYFPGCDFRKNILVGGSSGSYPADNYFPAELDDVGFVDLEDNADLRLTEVSDYHNAAIDGTDLGADKATPA